VGDLPDDLMTRVHQATNGSPSQSSTSRNQPARSSPRTRRRATSQWAKSSSR
jgi:hypothetical protein